MTCSSGMFKDFAIFCAVSAEICKGLKLFPPTIRYNSISIYQKGDKVV